MPSRQVHRHRWTRHARTARRTATPHRHGCCNGEGIRQVKATTWKCTARNSAHQEVGLRSVNAADMSLNGGFPLCIAAALGHGEVVSSLVAEGADVNAPNREGSTPLRLASPKYWFSRAFALTIYYAYVVRLNIRYFSTPLAASN